MLIVSNYHYIREDFSAPFPSIFGVTPKKFRAQLEELAKNGTFISGEELVDFKTKPFDKNYILITFDDGLKEQYNLARPILNEMGIPFLFFINTSNFENKKVSLVHKIHLLRSRISSADLLQEFSDHNSTNLTTGEKALAISHYNYDDEQTAVFKYLLNFKLTVPRQQEFIDPLFNRIFDEEKVVSGLYFEEEMLYVLHKENSLGSHSHRHLPLGQLSEEEVLKELKQTQRFFKNKFGKTAEAISYPYGSPEASMGISKAVKKAGFKLGFSMERAINKSLQEDSLLLSRFDCNDLPLGKNNLFKEENIFTKPLVRKWHQNEDSFINQR